ncbi:hypothetical protein [Cysteiniphilum sp. JM-1]|uniref:hypothetical protein n=1 Tax=Cysteiniphilum sp. JM-1 TaxID=2610891 RepID=UPI001247F057|nr:hypothetical protein [Cysteiniphilum sp. JM-1]
MKKLSLLVSLISATIASQSFALESCACISNETSHAVKLKISQVDNFDWDNKNERPDTQFDGKELGPYDAVCATLDTKSRADGSPYRVTLENIDTKEDIATARVNQQQAHITVDHKIFNQDRNESDGASNQYHGYWSTGYNTSELRGTSTLVFADKDLSADTNIELSNWQSKLSDDTLLKEVTLPGAHDAGVNNASPVSRHGAALEDSYVTAQEYDIRGMLNYGTRYFDLRPYDNNGVLRAGHFGGAGGGYGEKIVNIFDGAVTFLNSHPSEFVVFAITHTESDAPNDGEAHRSETAKKILALLGSQDYSKYIYRSTSNDLLNTPIEKLRGKMILLFDKNNGYEGSSENGVFSNSIISGSYANTYHVADMEKDQLSKLEHRKSNALFYLSWELTASEKSLQFAIRPLSNIANGYLMKNAFDFGAYEKVPNIVQYDFNTPSLNNGLINQVNNITTMFIDIPVSSLTFLNSITLSSEYGHGYSYNTSAVFYKNGKAYKRLYLKFMGMMNEDDTAVKLTAYSPDTQVKTILIERKRSEEGYEIIIKDGSEKILGRVETNKNNNFYKVDLDYLVQESAYKIDSFDRVGDRDQ